MAIETYAAKLTVGNVGDSRAIIATKGTKGWTALALS